MRMAPLSSFGEQKLQVCVLQWTNTYENLSKYKKYFFGKMLYRTGLSGQLFSPTQALCPDKARLHRQSRGHLHRYVLTWWQLLLWVWLLTRSILNGRRSFICIRVASGRTRQSTRVAPFPISRGRTCGQSQTFLSVSRQHYEWPLPLFNPGTLMAATLMYRFGHIQCAPVPALDTAGPCADQLIILYIII